MDTVSQLEAVLGRLDKCPLNVVRSEIDMFSTLLKQDVGLATLMDDLVRRHEAELGARVSTITSDARSSSWSDLGFANTPSLRAAVGYQACESLLNEKSPIKFGKAVLSVGQFYWTYQGGRGEASPVEGIRVFADVFLAPLLGYLRGAMDTHARIVLLLSRYRQRAEWFPDEAQLGAAGPTNEAELRRDFLRYLFDNGIDLVVEAETPDGGGKVDVLPSLRDEGMLPVEVKVFDGGLATPHTCRQD